MADNNTDNIKVRYEVYSIDLGLLRQISETAIWWNASAEIYGYDLKTNEFICIDDGTCVMEEPEWLVSKYKLDKPYTLDELRESIVKHNGKYIGPRGELDKLVFQEWVKLKYNDSQKIITRELPLSIYGKENITEWLEQERKRIIDDWNVRTPEITRDLNKIQRIKTENNDGSN